MNVSEKTISDRKALCQELQQKCKEKYLTQKKLEELTDIKQESISRMFKGEFGPKLDFILLLCEAAGLRLVLIEDTEKKP